MPNIEDINLPESVGLNDLKFIKSDNTIVQLPEGVGLNDLVLVNKEDINQASLPQGVGLDLITAIDKEGHEYYLLNYLDLGDAYLNNLTHETTRIVGNEITLSEINKANQELLEEATKDKFRVNLKYGDVNVDKYNYDQNNNYAFGDAGVEIDGFLFFPEEVKGEESYARREYNRTKIMSGGEFVTRGQYTPKEYSFTTTLDIDANKPYEYDKLFQMMENKVCEVVSPYMGDIFKATVEIDKTHPKASPHSLQLDIKVKEVVDPHSSIMGDTPIKYPSTSAVGDDAIDVRTLNKYEPTKKPSKEETEDAKIKADSTKYYPDGKIINEDNDPLSNKNMNKRRGY